MDPSDKRLCHRYGENPVYGSANAVRTRIRRWLWRRLGVDCLVDWLEARVAAVEQKPPPSVLRGAELDGVRRIWRVLRTLEHRVEAFEQDGARSDLRVADFDSLVGRMEALEKRPAPLRPGSDVIARLDARMAVVEKRLGLCEKDAHPSNHELPRADLLEVLADAFKPLVERVEALELGSQIHLDQHQNHARAVSSLLAEFRAASDRVKRMRAPAFGTD
jgi:hypothetical protein